MKSLIAIAAGVVTCFIAGFIVLTAGNALVGSLYGVDFISAQGAAALGTPRATATLLAVVLSYFTGSFAGGYVAARLAPARRVPHALAAAGFQMIFGVIQLWLFPSPLWFALAVLLAFPAGAVLGSALSRV